MASSNHACADSALSDADSSPKPASASCPVCNEVYGEQEPKLLPCAHHFCRKCLVTWFASSTDHPACPICKRRSISSSDYANICAELDKRSGGSKSAEAVKDSAQDAQVTAAASAPDGCGAQKFEESNPKQKVKGKTQTSAKTVDSLPESSAKDESERGVEGFGDTRSESKPSQASKMSSESHDQNTSGEAALGGVGSNPDKCQKKGNSSETVPTVSEVVVDWLPTDRVLAALADSTRKLCPPHVCSVCPDGRTHAVDLCLECGDLLCRSCSVVHSRLNATRSHEVKHIDDLTPEQLARQVRETCKDHGGQPLELYCPSHARLMCLVCFPVSHSQCQGVETVADAAKRLRQTLQTQIQQLTDARTVLQHKSASVQQQVEELSKSQVQVSKDISALFDRITNAVSARKEELRKQGDETPLPLKKEYQQSKEEVDELLWVLSANQQLVSDSLQNASDANFLRVFDLLTTRMTQLTSQAKLPEEARSSVGQCAVLSVDQYDVLRIEDLLRALGSVEIVERNKEKEKGAQSFLPPATASAGPAQSEDFNPFTCSPRNTGEIAVEGLRFPVVTMCKGEADELFACDTQSLFSVRTSHPFHTEQISALPCSVRNMAYMQGELVMTTEKPLLLFVDVTKDPKPPITTLPVSKAYRGITKGLDNTIVVSPDGSSSTLDVITREGCVLRRLSLGRSVTTECLCRLKDFIIVSNTDGNGLLKVSLETGKAEVFVHQRFGRDKSTKLHMTVDHKDRLYLTHSYEAVVVMNLKGQVKWIGMFNMGGIVVSADGRAFSFHPSPPHDVPLLVYDLNKT